MSSICVYIWSLQFNRGNKCPFHWSIYCKIPTRECRTDNCCSSSQGNKLTVTNFLLLFVFGHFIEIGIIFFFIIVDTVFLYTISSFSCNSFIAKIISPIPPVMVGGMMLFVRQAEELAAALLASRGPINQNDTTNVVSWLFILSLL